MEFTADAITQILQSAGKRLTHSLGQNFLYDEKTLRAIVNAVGEKNQNIIEIGAGVGLLTSLLCENHKKVVTVEIDESLRPLLLKTVKYDNFTLEISDILKADLSRLSAEYFDGGAFAVVGNLPYYITTKIVDKLYAHHTNFNCAVIMVQKEFADRMFAFPGSKEYRATTVCMQTVFDIERICEVPPHCFVPAPHINSTVLRLTPKPTQLLSQNDAAPFAAFVNQAFAARRKQLCSVAGALHTDRQTLAAAVNRMGLPPDTRAETLTPRTVHHSFLSN